MVLWSAEQKNTRHLRKKNREKNLPDVIHCSEPVMSTMLNKIFFFTLPPVAQP